MAPAQEIVAEPNAAAEDASLNVLRAAHQRRYDDAKNNAGPATAVPEQPLPGQERRTCCPCFT